jgi:hypothetical protein
MKENFKGEYSKGWKTFVVAGLLLTSLANLGLSKESYLNGLKIVSQLIEHKCDCSSKGDCTCCNFEKNNKEKNNKGSKDSEENTAPKCRPLCPATNCQGNSSNSNSNTQNLTTSNSSPNTMANVKSAAEAKFHAPKTKYYKEFSLEPPVPPPKVEEIYILV